LLPKDYFAAFTAQPKRVAGVLTICSDYSGWQRAFKPVQVTWPDKINVREKRLVIPLTRTKHNASRFALWSEIVHHPAGTAVYIAAASSDPFSMRCPLVFP
jgi:hypothetical protein